MCNIIEEDIRRHIVLIIKIAEATAMVQPWLRKYLGFKDDTPDEIVEKEWKRRTKHVCKPCWELKYCPYGPLVEQFPLSEDESEKAKELGWYARLVKGKGWVPCRKNEKGAIPDVNRVYSEFGSLNEHSCRVFGHICPTFLVNDLSQKLLNYERSHEIFQELCS